MFSERYKINRYFGMETHLNSYVTTVSDEYNFRGPLTELHPELYFSSGDLSLDRIPLCIVPNRTFRPQHWIVSVTIFSFEFVYGNFRLGFPLLKCFAHFYKKIAERKIIEKKKMLNIKSAPTYTTTRR